MIDIRCITDCASPDCVLVVAPKYCICTEGDTVSTDAGGFKQPAPTDTAEAARRNPDLVTGEPRIGGEVATRPVGFVGETDTLPGEVAVSRVPVTQSTVVGTDAPLNGDTTVIGETWTTTVREPV